MAETRRDCVTLAALLALLKPYNRVVILSKPGTILLDVVAVGTVQNIKAFGCVKACGDNVIEEIGMGVDESTDEWESEGVPFLSITIGGKAADA